MAAKGGGVPAEAAAERAESEQLVQAQRFAAQLLSGEPARSPVEVAERLLAIQGQDPRGRQARDPVADRRADRR